MVKCFSYQFLCLILLGIGANSMGMAKINNFFSASAKRSNSQASAFNQRRNNHFNPSQIKNSWNNDSFNHYISLKKELKQCNSEIQENKKFIAGWHTLALGIAPAAFCGMALDIAPGLMLGIAACPGLVGVCSSAVTIPSSLRNLWQQRTNRSRIETEIRQVLVDQKRESSLAQDIQ